MPDLSGLLRRRPRLSVVVPVFNVEAYLDECLTSLREQDLRSVEILVVDDDSHDGSRAIAERHAAADRRVRILTRPNGGLGAARNTGVEAATGEYLAFVDADDVVNPGAFSPAVSALQRSGSDFAVLNYERLGADGRSGAGWWIREVHDRLRTGVTLDDFPEIQVNAVAWSKVYRRRFYDAAGLRFPEGLVYEDQPVSSRAYARAGAFDVLPDVGVAWRTRDDGSSLSQQTASAANLADHNRAVELSLSELTDAGHDRAAQLRAVQLLTHNLAFFAHSLLGADDAFREQFRRGLQMLLDRAPHEEYVHTVNVRSKVIHELFLAGRTEDLERFIADGPPNVRVRPTTVTATGVLSEVGVDEISEESRLIPDHQTRLRARILEDTTSAAGERVLRGFAFIRNVDLTGRDFTTTATLISSDGSRTALPLTHVDAPEANAATPHDFCDFTPSGFLLTLPAPSPSAPGRLELTVTMAALTRTTTLPMR